MSVPFGGPGCSRADQPTDEESQSPSKLQLQQGATARFDKAARGRAAGQWWVSASGVCLAASLGFPAPRASTCADIRSVGAPDPTQVETSARAACSRSEEATRRVPRKASAVCPHKRLPAWSRSPRPAANEHWTGSLALTTP